MICFGLFFVGCVCFLFDCVFVYCGAGFDCLIDWLVVLFSG